MYNESILAILVFTIVMVIFNIVKDYILKYYGDNIPEDHIKRAKRRFIYSYIIGVVLLLLFYSRGSP